MKILKKFITLSVLSLSIVSFADDLNIAIILATGDHQSSSMREKFCVVDGLLRNAKKSGLPINWVFYDNDRSVIKTGQAARAIVNDGTDLVIAPLVSREGLAAVEILENAEIPTIVTGTTPRLTQDKDYVIGVLANDFYQSKILANYASSINPKKIIIVENSSKEYSQFMSKEFSNSLKEKSPDIEILREEIYKDYPFFKKLAEKIVSENPDIIFTPLYVPSVAQFYTALVEKSNKSLVLGSDSVGGRKRFYNIIGHYASNDFDFHFIKNSNGSFQGPESDLFYKIHRTYCEPKGIAPTFIGALFFDATRLLLKSVEKNGVDRGLSLIKSIKSQPYQGVLGLINFYSLETQRSLHLYKVGDGENEYIKPLSIND